ncbi:hypothetical protein B9Z55_011176 [Caenorhabditis nigoni]|uniref:Sdz-33 F-box domain-containing protein n=1 Tax=Caenorhabditis nigoni TaxID=1611254 RepID=A0A2G5UIY1_9PELO|nr:hypothetical protein B9Z55_011176 [Caenorhabditis nigoni]
MTDQRFSFHCLPDDLRLKVLQTTGHQEIIAYSFLSKKAFSTVKALRLPIFNVRITMKKQPEIEVTLSFISIKFELNMRENDEKMTHLNGFPVDVKVIYENSKIREFSEILSVWSDQGKSVGEWIQHLCSINQPKYCYIKTFHVREIEFDTQTLRNVFPKLGNTNIIFNHAEANEHDVQSAKNILKAFLVQAKCIGLEHVPLQDHFSLQHIGMGNLESLNMQYPRNMNVHDLSTLNAERIWIDTDQMSLRDLNWFLKLWMKGSNWKLKELAIFWDTDSLPDWIVLLRGLKAKPKGNSRKKFIIKNCREIFAEIETDYDEGTASIEFTVSN